MFLGLHQRLMTDYFSYLLLKKIEALKKIFTITFYDGQLKMSLGVLGYGTQRTFVNN